MLSPVEVRARYERVRSEVGPRVTVVAATKYVSLAEMAVLADATGSASKLVTTDREVLRKMRHADKEVGVVKRGTVKGGVAGNGDSETL